MRSQPAKFQSQLKAMQILVALCLASAVLLAGWTFAGRHRVGFNVMKNEFLTSNTTCFDLAQQTEEEFSPSYRARREKVAMDAQMYAFHKWNGTVSKDRFDYMHAVEGAMGFFKIYEGNVYVKKRGVGWDRIKQDFWDNFEQFVEMLMLALYRYQIPDMDFIVDFEGGGLGECDRPVLTYTVDEECEMSGFTIPSPLVYRRALGPVQLDTLFHCLNGRYPYADSRDPRAVWRGSPSFVLNSTNFMRDPGVQLAFLGRHLTHVMDAGLSSYEPIDGMDPLVEELLSDTIPLLSDFYPLEDLNKYMFILNMNDKLGTDNIFGNILTFNTPVLKQHTEERDHFTHLLEAHDSVLFFQKDLRGLVTILEGLIEERRSDGWHGWNRVADMREFAKMHLSHLGVLRSLAYVLNVYGEKMAWETVMEDGYVQLSTELCCRWNPSLPVSFLGNARMPKSTSV